MTQATKKQECQHDLKKVTRPLRIEQDPKKRAGSQFKYQGATLTMMMCQKKNCDYQRPVDYKVIK